MHRYMQGTELAKGGQGVVYRSRCILTQRTVVEKIYLRPTRGPILDRNTLDILLCIRNHAPSQAHFLEILELPSLEHPRMVLEYCEGGDLSQYIKNHHDCNTRIPEGFIWHVIEALASAVGFLHNGRIPSREEQKADYAGKCFDNRQDPNKDEAWRDTMHKSFHNQEWKAIIHRDIKPANVLLARPLDAESIPIGAKAVPDIKLADFDLAGWWTYGDTQRFSGGTYSWQPAEQWAGDIPCATPAGDIWAVGAIVHAMATGKPPAAVSAAAQAAPAADVRGMGIELESQDLQEEAQKRALPKVVKHVFKTYSRDLDHTMWRALDPKHERRLTAEELLYLVRTRGARSMDAFRKNGMRGRGPWCYAEPADDWEFVKMENGGEWPANDSGVNLEESRSPW